MKKVERVFMAALMGLSVMFMSVSCGGNKDVTGSENESYEGFTEEEMVTKFFSAGSYDMVSKNTMDMDFPVSEGKTLPFSQITIIKGTIVIAGTNSNDKATQIMDSMSYALAAKTDEGFEFLETLDENDGLVILFPQDAKAGTLVKNEVEQTYTIEGTVDSEDSVQEFFYSEFMGGFSEFSNVSVVINSEKK